MNKLNYFETREECKEFLDKFNFKYFIPYLEDFIAFNRYHVQLSNDKTKVIYCEIEALHDGMIHNSQPFYDCNRAYDFELAVDGEKFRGKPNSTSDGAVYPDETKTFTVGIIMPEFCDQRYLRDRDKDFEAKNEEQAIAKYREYAFKHYLNEDEKLAVMRGKIKIGIVK